MYAGLCLALRHRSQPVADVRPRVRSVGLLELAALPSIGGERWVRRHVAWAGVAQEWTVPAPERTDPDKIAVERTALEQWLDYQRDTVLTCAGLTAEQLRQRAVPPSNLSLLGLVRHLADVERGWLRQCAAREDVPDLYYTEAVPQADFDAIERPTPRPTWTRIGRRSSPHGTRWPAWRWTTSCRFPGAAPTETSGGSTST